MSSAADILPSLRMIVRAVLHWAGRWARGMAKGLLLVTVTMLVLACTRVPFDVHRWLGNVAGGGWEPPKVIVVLGGSGMPSAPELLRLHHAAQLAKEYPAAQVIVIHPDSAGTMHQMVSELLLRRVQADRIQTIPHGENTREQALIFARHHAARQGQVVLVTAPENMYRSVRTFRKAGFGSVCGAPAWENPMFIDLGYGHRRIGGKAWVPDVSDEPGLRYTFWNYLKLEVTCLREYVAIAYYWVNDWI